jgi:hypothetical protein
LVIMLQRSARSYCRMVKETRSEYEADSSEPELMALEPEEA